MCSLWKNKKRKKMWWKIETHSFLRGLFDFFFPVYPLFFNFSEHFFIEAVSPTANSLNCLVTDFLLFSFFPSCFCFLMLFVICSQLELTLKTFLKISFQYFFSRMMHAFKEIVTFNLH